jgi:hypothetical protein
MRDLLFDLAVIVGTLAVVFTVIAALGLLP